MRTLIHVYIMAYSALLWSAAIVTVGRVIYWIMNSDHIDPGPPNARQSVRRDQ